MRGPWQHLSWMLMRHLAPPEKKKTLAHWPRRHPPLPPSPDPQPPPHPSLPPPSSSLSEQQWTPYWTLPLPLTSFRGLQNSLLPSPLPLYLAVLSHCNTPALYRWRGGPLSITLHSFTLYNNRQLARILSFKHLFGGGVSSVAAMCRRRCTRGDQCLSERQRERGRRRGEYFLPSSRHFIIIHRSVKLEPHHSAVFKPIFICNRPTIGPQRPPIPPLGPLRCHHHHHLCRLMANRKEEARLLNIYGPRIWSQASQQHSWPLFFPPTRCSRGGRLPPSLSRHTLLKCH